MYKAEARADPKTRSLAMSSELDELLLLFAKLNTQYKHAKGQSKPKPCPRSQLTQAHVAELPPPVRFVRRTNAARSPQENNSAANPVFAIPGVLPASNPQAYCPENVQHWSDYDTLLQLLQTDHPNVSIPYIRNTLNEL